MYIVENYLTRSGKKYYELMNQYGLKFDLAYRVPTNARIRSTMCNMCGLMCYVRMTNMIITSEY